MIKRFKNTTGTGNVSAMRIEVTEAPHSQAGKAHARLVCELTNGTESTRAGKYFPTLGDAIKQAAEWEALAMNSGLIAV